MVDAPEKIWIEQDDCPYFYEESELAEVGSPVTEYIRADLCHRPALEPYSAREQALEEAETQGNLKQWNIQDHLKTPGSIAEYLQATLDEGGSELLINAVSDVIRALKPQQNTETSAIEKKKFYHNEWPHDALMAARRDGFIDHNGGEAWRYQFTHKDEKGKYDLLYRDTSNSSIQAALPPAQTGGGDE